MYSDEMVDQFDVGPVYIGKGVASLNITWGRLLISSMTVWNE